MINFLNVWVKNLCLALVVVSILEMLLPNNKTKKYIKMVMGLYILFSIISPFVKNKDMLNINVENIYKEYSVETASSDTKKINQNSMNNRLNELYSKNLENDITKKLENKGYNINSCKVKVHISQNNDTKETGIEQIKLNVDSKKLNNNEKENYNKETNNESDNQESTINSQISAIDLINIKNFLIDEYGVDAKCLKIN